MTSKYMSQMDYIVSQAIPPTPPATVLRKRTRQQRDALLESSDGESEDVQSSPIRHSKRPAKTLKKELSNAGLEFNRRMSKPAATASTSYNQDPFLAQAVVPPIYNTTSISSKKLKLASPASTTLKESQSSPRRSPRLNGDAIAGTGAPALIQPSTPPRKFRIAASLPQDHHKKNELDRDNPFIDHGSPTDHVTRKMKAANRDNRPLEERETIAYVFRGSKKMIPNPFRRVAGVEDDDDTGLSFKPRLLFPKKPDPPHSDQDTDADLASNVVERLIPRTPRGKGRGIR